MVPIENTDPGICDLVQVSEPGQFSVAVGSVHDTVAVHNTPPLVRVMFEAVPFITGFSASFMVTVKDAETVLPLTSVAV